MEKGDNIRYLHTASGADIISIVEEAEGKIRLVKPVMIVLDPQSGSVRLAPWPFPARMGMTDDEEFEVRAEFIVTSGAPADNLLNNYRTQVLGGIATPDKTLVLPG